MQQILNQVKIQFQFELSLAQLSPSLFHNVLQRSSLHLLRADVNPQAVAFSIVLLTNLPLRYLLTTWETKLPCNVPMWRPVLLQFFMPKSWCAALANTFYHLDTACRHLLRGVILFNCKVQKLCSFPILVTCKLSIILKTWNHSTLPLIERAFDTLLCYLPNCGYFCFCTKLRVNTYSSTEFGPAQPLFLTQATDVEPENWNNE